MVTPATGYLLVVLICIMSGKSLQHDLTFTEFISITPEQFLYWLLLVPVFINRVIMYEQASHKNISTIDMEWKKISLHLPIIIFLFSIFVFVYLNFSFVSTHYSTFKFEADKIVILVASLFPLYFMTIISWIQWKNQQAKKYFNFRYYIFFPALSTCVISFLVGWTELSNFLVISIPSLIIILYYILTFYDNRIIWNWKSSDWVFLTGLITVFFYQFVIVIPFKISSTSPIDSKNGFMITLSCVMMSMIMGITETWWFIKDSNNKDKFTNEALEFYQTRVAKITISLPLIMPLCIFDPHTNNNFYLILIYAISLCIIWLYGQGIKNSYWRWIRFGFGIILPILFALSLRDTVGIESPIKDANILNIIPGIALLLGLIAFLSRREKSNRFFSDLSNEKQIGIAICVIFIVLFWVLFQAFFIDTGKIAEKLNLLILFYTIILLILLFEIIYKLIIYSGGSEDSNSKNSTLNNILLFIYSGRPWTSPLAGILAFIIIYNVQQNIVFSLLKSIPIVFVTMLGFVYNDIYDKAKDKLAGRQRPITNDKLSTLVATKFIIISIIFILFYEYFINNIFSFYIILLTLIGVIFYSPISRKYPFLKSIYTALLCCTPLIYGYAIADSPIIWYKLIPIFMFNIGREIWIDKKDMHWDLSYNIKTIPFYLGIQNSYWIAFSFMVSSGCLIFLFATTEICMIIAAASLLSLLICFIIAKKNEPLAIKISRIPMLLGIFALTI